MKLLYLPAIALFLPIASGTTPGLSPGATIDLGHYLQCANPLTGSPAIPVTGEMTGNGGSSFQLFQDREGIVYATWSLKTNNLNNGADTWVFGIELDDIGDEFAFTAAYVEPSQMGVCRKVGPAPVGAFEYFVDAGAGGWSGSSSCTVGFSWSLTVGVTVSLTNAAGSVSTTLGVSASCSDGVNFDSESLIRGKGTGSVACLTCLDQVLP